jgi:putative glutamine amidotransferase
MTSLYRPLIGLTTAEIADHHPSEPPFWGIRSSYCRPLLAKQATPVLLPHIQTLTDLGGLLSELDGLLIPDGADIDPARYHHPPDDNIEVLDPVRDQTETVLLAWALEQHLPILAISRGMHMVNVAAGGTLHQDIPTDLNLPTEHRQQPVAYQNLRHHGHLIQIEPGSRLADVTGHPEIWVNSMHHQAIHKLGTGLVVTARSADQVIEAIEAADPETWLLGLQSHPEAVVEDDQWVKKLFRDFIQAAREFHAAHHDAV